MKKMLSFMMSAIILCSTVLSGCVSPIQRVETENMNSSELAADDSDLEEGEVYFHFSQNPEEIPEPEQIDEEPSTCPLSQSRIDAIAKNADDVIAQYPDFSGTVLLSSGNRVIYEKSYGKTGVKNNMNENDTLYQIGSVTKQFTGTAILQLAKEGKLRTSDTLDKFFPEYKDEFVKTITVEQLLEMTSGMGDYMELIEGDEKILADYVKAAGKSEKDAKNFIVKTIFEGGIYTDPGTVYTYSNSAYYLLGIIIEQITGSSYRDYLKKIFFDKAGMKNTYFVGDGKDCCTGYSYAQEKYVCDKDSKELKAEGDYPYLFSAGSVVSNVEDVNKWLGFVTSDEIFTREDRKIIEKSLMFYNYGWNTSDDLWHHSGRTYAYSSQVYADYHTDTKLVVLTNIAFYTDLNEISLKLYLPLVNAVKQEN